MQLIDRLPSRSVRFARHLAAVVMAVSLAGCASTSNLPQLAEPSPTSDQPDLAEAMEGLSSALTAQLEPYRRDRGRDLWQRLASSPVVAVDAFIDVKTGFTTPTGQRMQHTIAAHLGRALKPLQFTELSTEALRQAGLVMSGSFQRAPSEAIRGLIVNVSLTDVATGIVAANAQAFIADPAYRLDTRPSSIFQDSPVGVADDYVAGLIATTRTEQGLPAARTYHAQLSTLALLAEGQRAFDRGDLQGALSLYRRAQSRPDGRSLRLFSALYVIHTRLGDMRAAERAFGEILSAAFANQSVPLRLLFQVNSTDFIAEPRLEEQYRMWLRQMAQFIGRHLECVEIHGHSSRTGRERYNDRLSSRRAETVQRLMTQEAAQVAQWTRLVGRGFRDVIVGSGTDDARDAVDRRVDFKVTPCSPANELPAAAPAGATQGRQAALD